MRKEEVLQALQKPSGSDALLKKAQEAVAPALLLLSEGNAPAAGFLARAAKQKACRQQIEAYLTAHPALAGCLLCSETPKMRKNMARLLGQLGRGKDTSLLIEALRAESVRMVRPSFILALGAQKTAEAAAFLEQYRVEPAADRSEQKHEAEEAEALRVARAALRDLQTHAWGAAPIGWPAELRCGRGLETVLERELALAGMRVTKRRPGRVNIRIKSWESLERCRVFREVLFILGPANEPPEKAAQSLLTLLDAAYAGGAPYAFRLEMKKGERAAVKDIARRVEVAAQGALVNAPSRYEAELRLERGIWYAKLLAAPDTRFAYRKGAVPASMHPANAAGVVRLAAPYIKPGATVLDPCCGSGTLLIERGLFSPCRALWGVDLQPEAVRIAKENLRAAAPLGLAHATVRCGDMLALRLPRPVDEIWANLPFGNRVGNHAYNVRLYQGLVQRLPAWLAPGGIAVLYTMEGKLLRQCLAAAPPLTLLEEHRVEAGGLEPKVLIVRR